MTEEGGIGGSNRIIRNVHHLHPQQLEGVHNGSPLPLLNLVLKVHSLICTPHIAQAFRI